MKTKPIGKCKECNKILYDRVQGMFSVAIGYYGLGKNGLVCKECYDKTKHFFKQENKTQ